MRPEMERPNGCGRAEDLGVHEDLVHQRGDLVEGGQLRSVEVRLGGERRELVGVHHEVALHKSSWSAERAEKVSAVRWATQEAAGGTVLCPVTSTMSEFTLA